MSDFTVRSDAVNVEQIMEQIRARIREKRGVDYTEQQIRELASVKLEKFLDPRGVRSDLLTLFQQAEPDPNYAFEADTLFETHRAPLRFLRRLLRPVLMLLLNPNKLAYVLHMQSDLNARNARRQALSYELLHNLVLETTKLGIEVKNLKVRAESLASRLEFSERRARALEGAVLYRPATDDADESLPPPVQMAAAVTAPPAPPPSASAPMQAGGTSAAPATAGPEGPGQRSRRRRRRRGRRSGATATAMMGGASGASADQQPEADHPAPADESGGDEPGSIESDDEP
jgi:hypothetical protein